MDLLYAAILIAFFVLISALALACAHLQTRRGALRQRNGAAASSAPLPL